MNIVSQRIATATIAFAALLLSFPVLASTAAAGEMVSIVSLIARPEEYDGKQVIVTGFLALDFEGSAIYLHEDDYENLIFKNGLWYAGDVVKYKRFDKKYVNVEGTFDAKNQGHLGLGQHQALSVSQPHDAGRQLRRRSRVRERVFGKIL